MDVLNGVALSDEAPCTGTELFDLSAAVVPEDLTAMLLGCAADSMCLKTFPTPIPMALHG